MDRADDREVLEVIRFINSIGNFQGISYLLAYDVSRIRNIISSGGSEKVGENYLKKIIQLDVPLRPMFDYEIDEILKASLSDSVYDQLKVDRERWDEVRSIIGPMLETPRDVKRAVPAFTLLHRSVGDEIDKIDLFAYAVLQSLSMIVTEALHLNFDYVVIDPAVNDYSIFEVLMEGRNKSKSNIEKIKLREDEFGGFEKLLRFIFPSERNIKERSAFGRLCERKNFLTVTYLGNPPFRVSRNEIIEFWNNPIPQKIESVFLRGLIEDFIIQCGRLFQTLDPVRDRDAITCLVRSTELRRAEIGVRIREGYELIVAAIIDPNIASSRERLCELFDALVAAGDFRITPSLLRRHMFAFGLVDGRRDAERPLIFTEDQFAEKMMQEVERYRAAIRRGRWIAEGVSIDCFFALQQSGHWGAEDRQSLEAALEIQGNVSDFASLFSPPGNSFERNTIELFVSEEKLKAKIAEHVEADEYLELCRKRMLKLLNGVHWSDLGP